ncbi:MarR family winged helix-turn-helix transcriptional regulator [Flavobacterium saccharophilum]|uniref:Transcriptional regulator n=1 Tax=Flavobacterium saccharophilum TaxID=29534 RepID=A0A1M7HQN0_9FLAO|nr:helix-turn-helix domain-containing protein [Flavobacterium saccharophilum]SHM30785.1 transcriptional regulator [Flavobacterium saccharophilum]
MKNIFDLETQNDSLDAKITAGFERLSQVFRVLLWEKAKNNDLSPIQIQLLIFIKYHSANKATVSYLAKEFNLAKATVSDSIRVLEQKKYITKVPHTEDSRSSTIALTPEGIQVVDLTENFTDPVYDIIASTAEKDKIILWRSITSFIQQLNHIQIISAQNSCSTCDYFEQENGSNHCRLLQIRLKTEDIKLDCQEHKPARL